MSEIDRGFPVGRIIVTKYWADDYTALLAGRDARPYDEVEHHNMFVNGGWSCLWECLIGNGTTTGGGALTYFNNANAAIGVGDSSTAAAAGQTDLQAASNKLRLPVNATFPQHSDGVAAGSRDITYQATAQTGQANWTWNEVALFNSATAGQGRMFNRSVNNYGTKTSASAWLITLVLSGN